jgi:DNA invertase Pin-like site-specific DNA recombinase
MLNDGATVKEIMLTLNISRPTFIKLKKQLEEFPLHNEEDNLRYKELIEHLCSLHEQKQAPTSVEVISITPIIITIDIIGEVTEDEFEQIRSDLHRGVTTKRDEDHPDELRFICDGVRTGGRPKTLSEKQTEEIKKQYISGSDAKELAKAYGCGLSTIKNITTALKKERDTWRNNQITRLLSLGKSDQEIAIELNISRTTVYQKKRLLAYAELLGTHHMDVPNNSKKENHGEDKTDI